jgi:hypothetical protein
MSFLKRVFGRGCSHRLTWPRLGNNGQHYQVCLNCGAAFEYDWQGMRLTGRLLATGGLPAFNGAQPGSPEPGARH